ncbi:MAG: hypothetical protein E4H01_01055 [Lysobacterales bacterium]|nr:MAG: hypothetical protein E4H01_01055 [Xanthomonadales bacterium]
MSANRRCGPRALLVGTFLIFLLPVVGAWLLNVYAPDWRPFGTLNHGTLVQPVRQVGAARLRHLDGGAMDLGYFSGRWTLVHLSDGDCAQPCIDALLRSHQVQKALGDNMDRVQLLLVLNRPTQAQALELPAAISLAGADQQWLASFTFAEATPGQSLRIYLVDPQGYLMMRYDPATQQRDLLADLKRLLKISKIG